MLTNDYRLILYSNEIPLVEIYLKKRQLIFLKWDKYCKCNKRANEKSNVKINYAKSIFLKDNCENNNRVVAKLEFVLDQYQFEFEIIIIYFLKNTSFG